VCSDYDLNLALVAGSKDLISAVLKNSILEALLPFFAARQQMAARD
jgi:hypothetical protein